MTLLTSGSGKHSNLHIWRYESLNSGLDFYIFLRVPSLVSKRNLSTKLMRTVQTWVSENGSSCASREHFFAIRRFSSSTKLHPQSTITQTILFRWHCFWVSFTDFVLQKTIRESFSGLTILTIAHRLNTIIDYDRVMVLDDGKIVELDTPENLFNRKDGVFRSMCDEGRVSWGVIFAHEYFSSKC